MAGPSLMTVKPPYYGARQAATLAGVGYSTLMHWIREQAIPSYFELEREEASDGRRGWVRKRDLRIDPETGKAKDVVQGKPVYVDINELREFLERRAREKKGLL